MGEWVSICRTGDSVRASLVASILEQEGIPCIVRNQGAQNLFGVGVIGAGYNPVTGPIDLLVAEELAEKARGILRDVEQAARESDPQEPVHDEYGEDRLLRRVARALAWCWLLGLAMSLFGGIGGSVVGLSVGLVLLVLSLFGFSYKLHLHRLGYEWPTLMDANWILLRLGWRKAYRIPPAAEVETLPEIGAGDPDSIISFVKRLQRHKREMAKEIRRPPSQPSPGA